MKLIYNGVDITSRVFINRCEHETFAEKRADRLLIRLSIAATGGMLGSLKAETP